MKSIIVFLLLAGATSAFAQKLDTLHIHKTLHKGWNLVAFPHHTSMRIDSALSAVWSNVLTVKDEDNFYVKNGDQGMNRLTHLQAFGGYWIKVSDDCELVHDFVKVDTSCCTLKLPNAFSPQSTDNTLNTYKAVVSDCCKFLEFKMQIYSRFGEQLFETSNSAESWDGKQNGTLLSADTYIVRIKYVNGLGIKKTINANLVLIR